MGFANVLPLSPGWECARAHAAWIEPDPAVRADGVADPIRLELCYYERVQPQARATGTAGVGQDEALIVARGLLDARDGELDLGHARVV